MTNPLNKRKNKYESNSVTLKRIVLRLRKLMKYMRRKSRNEYNFFLDDKKASDGKFSYDWPELLFLRRNPLILGGFLIKLPLFVRRLVIMRFEITGFNKKYLYSNYDISNNLMTYFTSINEIESEMDTARIRSILTENYPSDFLAFIALLARVPMHWLTMDYVENIWTVEHFRQRCDAVLVGRHRLEEFINQLDPNIHDVYSVIFKSSDKYSPLYLRVENLFGSIIVELSNEKATIDDSKRFEMLFTKERYDFIKGYMSTVVLGQTNRAVMFRHHLSGKPLCKPIEFFETSNFIE